MKKCNNCSKEATVQIVYTRKRRTNYCVDCAKPAIKALDGSPSVFIDIQLGTVNINDAIRFYAHYPDVLEKLKNLKDNGTNN